MKKITSLLLLLICISFVAKSQSYTSVTYTTPGTYTYIVPAGVYYLQVESWGAGGGKSYGINAYNSIMASSSYGMMNESNGGGGGAYTRSTWMPVTPGQQISYTIGLGGYPHTKGGNTIFTLNNIKANGGGVSWDKNSGNSFTAADESVVPLGGGAETNGSYIAVSYKGGNGGFGYRNLLNESYPQNFNTAWIYAGGGGSSAGPGGAGSSGANGMVNVSMHGSDAFHYGDNIGYGGQAPTGGGAGGNGGSWRFTNTADNMTGGNGGNPGGGAGGLCGIAYWQNQGYYFSYYQKAADGQMIINTCNSNPGSITPSVNENSITIPYPSEGTVVINNVTAAVGYTKYTWEISKDNGTTWSTITGANGESYTLPTNMSSSYQLRRVANGGCNGSMYTAIYYVKVLNATNSSPLLNGTISGEVKSIGGAGVEGIVIKAQKRYALRGSSQSKMYTTTTDAQGKYTIQNIFYGDAGNGDISPVIFKITASSVGGTPHIIVPALGGTGDSIIVNLTNTNYVLTNNNFTDNTVYSVIGAVTQYCANCIKDFENDSINGIKITPLQVSTGYSLVYNTTGDQGYGKYGVTLSNPGYYKLIPNYLDHKFLPDTTTLNINQDFTGINFQDTTTRLITGKISSGDTSEYIGNVLLEFTDTVAGRANFKFKAQCSSIGGKYSIRLPARNYKIKVISFTPPISQSVDIDNNAFLYYFNTTNKDSMIARIGSINDTVNLIYHRPPVFKFINLKDTCGGYVAFQQNVKNKFRVEIYEGKVAFNDKMKLDSADSIKIVTNVHLENESSKDTILYSQKNGNGVDTIELSGGNPNILTGIGNAPSYLKYFQVTFVDKYGRRADSVFKKVLTTGSKAITGTFTTVEPDIPFLILHAPPGDKSTSTWSSNSTIESSNNYNVNTTNGITQYSKVKAGFSTTMGIGFISSSQLNTVYSNELSVSGSYNQDNEFISSINNSISYSTIPNGGDVFVGGAKNLKVARTYNLDFTGCVLGITANIGVAPQGFATTFTYSESHIKDVIIPGLVEMANFPGTADSVKKRYTEQADIWRKVLLNNEKNKARAAFDKNRSFDGNAGPISETLTTSGKSNDTYKYSVDLSGFFQIGGEWETKAGFYTGGEIGGKVVFNVSSGGTTRTSNIKETTFNYVLDDDDAGDYFSVDVKKDPVYATPVFSLVAGTSSCPAEPIAQSRDLPILEIPDEIGGLPNKIQTNIPVNNEVLYKIYIRNQSESRETRTYKLYFDQTSNPDGAIVTIGGNPSNTFTSYTIPFQGIQQVTISVRKNSMSNIHTYEGLKFYVEDGCETNVKVENTISAYFQNPCSNISMTSPVGSWLVNNSSYAILPVQFDVSNRGNLQSVAIEYAALNSNNWQSSTNLPQSYILSNSGTINWNATGIPDGVYDLRLKLTCASGIVYTQRLSGVIDRLAPYALGSTDLDDISYQTGEELSIMYQENINVSNLDSNYAKLMRKRDGLKIPALISGYENKLFFTPMVDLATNYAGDTLYIVGKNISDLNGNMSSAKDTFMFVVNAVPVISTTKTLNIANHRKSGIFENATDSLGIKFKLTAAVQSTTPTLVRFAVSGTTSFESDYTVSYSGGQNYSTIFTGSTGSIVIPAFSDSVIMYIKPKNDSVREDNETLVISLLSSGDYDLGTKIMLIDTIMQPAVLITNSNCLGSGVLSFNDINPNNIDGVQWYKDSVKLDLNQNSTGTIIAGNNGSGALANQLNSPTDVFVDKSGNAFVCDRLNNRVQKFAPGSSTGVTVAGGNGYGSNANQLGLPAGIFVDDSGNIYVADAANNRIQKWAPNATTGVMVAGGNGAGPQANQLNNPLGVWLDKIGRIYVTDQNNHRIIRYTEGNLVGTVVAGGNGNGSAVNQLSLPFNCYVDTSYNVYVADCYNHRIQKISASGAYALGVTVAGGNGYGSAANQLSYPTGVCVDEKNNIFVADKDNGRIQKFIPGSTSGATISSLSFPFSCFIGSTGNVYVPEYFSNRVQKFTLPKTYTPTSTGSYYAVVSNASGYISSTNTILIGNAPTVTGLSSVCMGAGITLTGTATPASANAWKSSNTAVATVSAVGLVTGVSAGVATITYTTNTGCSATKSITVKASSNSVETISAIDSYTWHGVTYTASTNTPRWTTANAAGCDSVVTLNLTITTICYPTTSTQNVTACNSYTWHGIRLYNSAVVDWVGVNAKGCDSTVTLNLTINAPTSSTTNVNVCSSQLPYVWNGVSYSSSGTFTKLLVNTKGCDSTAILVLKINSPSSKTVNVTICENQLPYLWNGLTCNAAGNFFKTLVNAEGCDSIVTLVLTTKATSSTISNIALCSNQLPYYWNGLICNAGGTFSKTLINAVGCDSNAILILAVKQSSSSVVKVVSTTPYTWHGVTYSTSTNSPTWIGVNSIGCDSIVTLNLVIANDCVPTSSVLNVAACGFYDWKGIRSTTSTILQWVGINAGGCDSVVTLNLTISSITPPAPVSITQTLVSNICGARVYRYTASASSNAIGYIWSLPASVGGVSGVIIDSGNANISQTIRVMYASNTAALTTDSIKVQSFNGCGNSVYRSLKLTNALLAVPAAPASITITLVNNVCGEKRYRFTAPVLPVATTTLSAATGYYWQFKGVLNAYIDSGTANSKAILVKFSSNAAAATGDSVKLCYTSLCGNSLFKASKLTNTLLTAPAAPIVTITAIQTNVCGVRKYRYSASALPVATSTASAAMGWDWSMPEGPVGSTGTIDSGALSSQTIVIAYTSNAAATGNTLNNGTADSIRVRFLSRNCGFGIAKSTKLTNTLLGAPLAPATITIATVSDMCGVRVYRYTAPALPIATTTAGAANGYLWSFPYGPLGLSAVLDSGSLVSQAIRIRYSSNAAAAAGDSIKVLYTSDCGNSPSKAQKLSNLAPTLSAAPATLTGTTSICSVVGAATSNRYIASAVTGALSYLWTLPAGAMLDSGSNGLKIKVRFITAGTNDSIYVQAVGVNGCAGAKKILKLVTTGCITLPTSRAVTPIVLPTEESMDVIVYPNPTTSAYQMFVKSSKASQPVKVRIIDLQGRLIKNFTFNSNETIAFGNELIAGVYMVEVRKGDKVKTLRVVKY